MPPNIGSHICFHRHTATLKLLYIMPVETTVSPSYCSYYSLCYALQGIVSVDGKFIQQLLKQHVGKPVAQVQVYARVSGMCRCRATGCMCVYVYVCVCVRRG